MGQLPKGTQRELIARLARQEARLRNPSLDITIGAITNRMDYSHELRLIKSALLYGDRVKVYSPLTALMRHMRDAKRVRPSMQVDALARLGKLSRGGDSRVNAITEEAFAKYKSIKAKQAPSKEDLAYALTLESYIQPLWPGIAKQLEEIFLGAGGAALLRAVGTGRVDLHEFKELEQEQVLPEYYQFIQAAVSSGKTYPLFDELTADYINATLREGKLPIAERAVARGKNVGLANYLFETLPLFDAASIDEILDIRKDLEKPLTNFRAGMARMSDTICSAEWDADFEHDADDVYIREVAPAVQAIKDHVQSSRAMRGFIAAAVAHAAVASLAFGLSHTADLLDQLGQIANTLMGAGTVEILADRVWSSSEREREIQQNALFFYYKVDQSLHNL